MTLPSISRQTRKRLQVALALVVLGCAQALASTDRPGAPPSLEQRLADLKPTVQPRLNRHFRRAGLRYPPREAVIVAFKGERRLLLYAGQSNERLRLVRDYFINGASGQPGPKLREGDYQVPEGLYRVTALNPNSSYHLSLRLDYPNVFDLRMADHDERFDLGGDIFLHGGVESAGCIAIDDRDIEELFMLAADMGLAGIRVILSPVDLRTADPDIDTGKQPAWTRRLYQDIRRALFELPRDG